MKKAILVLVIIIGIFTSCEQDEIFDDCNCVKTVYLEYVTQQPEPTYIVINKENVECQDEARVELSNMIIEVKCNPNY